MKATAEGLHQPPVGAASQRLRAAAQMWPVERCPRVRCLDWAFSGALKASRAARPSMPPEAECSSEAVAVSWAWAFQAPG